MYTSSENDKSKIFQSPKDYVGQIYIYLGFI